MIRAARPADVPAILAIWNPIIRDTAITFNPVEKTAEELATMLAEKAAAGHAYLVAELGTTVAGFATFGQFRAGAGYRRTFEHSIQLAPEARGRGVGRRLMTALEAEALALGGHSMFAGVSSGNPGARGFHARLGYREVAVLPEVGFKFGRWFDLHLMQKHLST